MRTFTTKRWATAALAGLFVVGLATIGQVDAGEVVDGNPTCEGYDFGYKADGDPSGRIDIDENGLKMSLTIGTHPDHTDPNPNNAVVSYVVDAESSVTSGRIIVKGGNAAILYSFGESTPLHAPPVGEQQKWPTISHLQVCWNEPEEPEYGRIELTKVVAGPVEDDGTVFVLCITGPSPADDTVCQKAVAGDTVRFDELEPGVYAISEEDPGDNWVVTYSDTTLMVVVDQTSSGTVTNTWTEEPELGSIEVTKIVTGDGAPDLDFEVCITGPDDDTTERCQDIAHDETAVFDDLQLGTYTVTETNPGLNWTTTGDGDVDIDSDEPATVTITNTWTEQEQLPPAPTPPTDVSPGGGSVTPQSGSLPVTGGDTHLMAIQALIAAGLLALGGTLSRWSRRPQRIIG